jgi:hypothetical protein
VWLVVISNVITVAVCFLFLRRLAGLTMIRGSLLIPTIILLIYIASFSEKNAMEDVFMMLAFGVLGLIMAWLKWPTPPLILGLVLGRLAEGYVFISTERYGSSWLTRPGVIGLAVVCLLVVAFPFIQKRIWNRGADGEDEQAAELLPRGRELPDIAFTIILLALAAGAVWGASAWSMRAALFPRSMALAMLALSIALLLMQVVRFVRRSRSNPIDAPSETVTYTDERGRARWLGIWLLGFLGAILALGFPIGGTIATLGYLRTYGREAWVPSIVVTAIVAAFFGITVYGLHLPYPDGLIKLPN